MVSIAVILLLVALVAVSLKAVRGSAQRTRSISALRQIMVAYRSYSDDNRGQLLPGYIGEDLFADGQPFRNLRVTLPDGTLLDAVDAQSYVWRLAPYVENEWQAFYTDTNDTGLMAQLEADYASGAYGEISERPTFGLNSIFVGGDSVHGGSDVTDMNPWTPTDPNVVIAATRFTQVKNPARLIVFGATAKANPIGFNPLYEDESLGFCELRAPYLINEGDPTDTSSIWKERQWLVGTGGNVSKTISGNYGAPFVGLPIIRHGNNVIPIGMLDGSTAAETLSSLMRDMRRWNPFEVALRDSQ